MVKVVEEARIAEDVEERAETPKLGVNLTNQ